MDTYEWCNVIIDGVTLITIIAGGIFALVQWDSTNKNRRADIISALVKSIRDDKIVSETMYMFDYEQYWYTKDFHGSKLERSVDQTLSHFSYICYLQTNNIISKKDFKFFEYEIKRIACNYSVQAYLYNLYHFSKKNSCDISFKYLFDYCYDNNLFSTCNDIKSKTNTFPKYLNFD